MQQNSTCRKIFRTTCDKRSRLYHRQRDDEPRPLLSVYHLNVPVVMGKDTVRD